ncbi:MAG: ribonuclease J [Candidatus Enterosoma sp.]|nr:ribonuclease J [bacterium]MDY3907967.1 ribonuclease J [Candidatus Enterosoma sp.]MDY5650183.1 ribonuclease J [Candidatus Enterosoma sp.]MDY5866385.1 ribonuclease J [Candidatus Enterosoma sp.]
MSENKLQSPVEVYALGGLDEVGKNLYCIENESSLIIIDCGVIFPEDDMPGVDYVIPDFTHLIENQKKIKALIITHGHEDHIGGIPFLLRQVDIPFIYAPKIAIALIRHKLTDEKINTPIRLVEYNEDSKLKLGDFSLEFFHVTHSIPDSFGIYIKTPQGTIVETGDFKIDLTPVDDDFSLSKLVKYGDSGIDLLMADSTNAEKEGYTPSEKTVIQGISDVFSEATGRLLISTFSSNISRIQQIIETSIKFKRKIIAIGRSMESNIQAAREYGYIKVPDSYLVGPESLKSLKPNEITILCTGTQGEPMAVLSRISRGEHKQIKVMPGDTIVFSSSVIPGNTASINKVINQLTRLGANVITNSVLTNLHASGHASKQEMRLLQKLARPKNFMPVHGEYRMLKLHSQLAIDCGLNRKNVFVCSNGDVLSLINHKVYRTGTVHTDSNYIDGKNTISVSTSVIKDRSTLINEGMVGIYVVIDPKRNELVYSPIVDSKGFISANKRGIQNKVSDILSIELKKLMKSGKKVTFFDIKQTVKTVAGHMFYRETKRNPMVIPIVLTYSNTEVKKDDNLSQPIP